MTAMADSKKSNGNSSQNGCWQEEFTFKFNYIGKVGILKVPIQIPFSSSIEGLVHILIKSHDLPCYLEKELKGRLKGFILHKTKEHADSSILSLCASVKDDGNAVTELTDAWVNAFEQKPIDVIHRTTVTNNDNYDFSEVYHSLIHSPALEMLLKLEHDYSIAVSSVISDRDGVLKDLQDQQSAQMDTLISQVGTTCSEDDVNKLANKQLEESQIQEISWSSALSDLQETQKRDYRKWVYDVNDDLRLGKSDISELPSLPAINYTYNDNETTTQYATETTSNSESLSHEESYTIHLGHQMKTMHNVRLLSGDVLMLCKHKPTTVDEFVIPSPQRLQTSMTLYSQALSGLILLVDNRLQSQLDIKKDFRTVCLQSTDFHFPDFDKQMCLVEQLLENRKQTVRGTSQIGHRRAERQPREYQSNNLLHTGDFYVTQHSNLSSVHVVFHLVSDDTVTDTNINSRHPVMVGLRHIMLASARHNIRNITVPLLLSHELMENFTLQWCMKRAELIYKCVKGFMMEGMSWDGVDSRTIQFIVPKGVSEELFTMFSAMIPTIFRVSTTLDLSDLTKK